MGPVQTGGVATETQYDGAGRATLQASGSVIGGTFTVVESTATQYDAGGTLQWASGNTQDVSSQFIALASGQTAILDTNGNDVTLASAISGDGSLTKAGSGTLTLTGADTVSGPTTVSGGALMIGGTAPTLSFGANQMAQQANPLTAYWGGTFSDAGFGSGFALAYSIDWGDGGPADSGDATIVTRGGPGVPTLGYFADEHTFSAPRDLHRRRDADRQQRRPDRGNISGRHRRRNGLRHRRRECERRPALIGNRPVVRVHRHEWA